jgi:PAS domain S-box-containing protein
VPGLEDSAVPPPVLIGGLRVAGTARPLSALGETSVVLSSLLPDQNNIQIDFFGIALRTGDALRYQYRLEGAEGGWSAPSPQRSVHYANLAPGTYRFSVRAVGMDGTPSDSPASASFEILPPLWRRAWFLALAVAIVGSGVTGLARYRYRRLQALRESEDRFRTLTEAASDAIITIDDRSRIVLVNQAAEKVFGYSRDELIGADLTMLMPHALRERHAAGFGRYVQTAARSMAWEAIELPGLHQDGHEVPLEISFGEFIRNGRRYFTGIARDITERRRAEDALRRSREERLAELERVRRRIATDLHDDIGSSLTRISLLGEVAQRQVQKDQTPLLEPLGTISDLSRELVDTMSDIVWAINPNKDHLSDLSQRMRHFASDVLHGPPDRIPFQDARRRTRRERGRERSSRGLPVVQGGGEQRRPPFPLHRGRPRAARRAGRPRTRGQRQRPGVRRRPGGPWPRPGQHARPHAGARWSARPALEAGPRHAPGVQDPLLP